ncbi:epididymal-specific lipocalin-8 isoform X6 [Canis lupus baileyi]|uniref:Lipocalin 8 n=1 Tax=Canis lupus familiaris TaxID=9615 RepID=A0A8C0M8W2_CANLF|nr:epididymal-specific lipocalin-8 isoform X2 [Canis lupus familiaris]XP_038404653.1 epididymal-specific lipocalin-8 isoform X2 [Canis lupus familiaris]XP_038533871.1 epididymal-specific lipocalin-8 isoform X2 [Canis lupus familiaris]XP_048970258.1 epididymal-specific lipocalin-8 isoform X6 [Canis lupus dingo]|eukprot:XP_005625139.1 epididymal-specific lipocalin-8 isoform X5 [Canis lupus familiaris]
MTSSASCAMGLLSQYKPGAGGAEARGAVMEAGLLSAILGLVTVQGETAMLDLDLQKIAGFWREVGVASSQNLALKTPKRLEALFLTLSGHELLVKAAYYSSGSCETENIVGSEIDMSGTFVFPGHREIQVVDTDYEQYAILRLSLHWQGKDFRVLKYFTRSLEDENGPGFWRFRELTADTGLYLVARHGRCAKLLKEGSSDCRADQPRARPGVGNLPGTCWIES